MASIRKRGEATWEVRVFLGRDERGRQRYHCKSVHGTKKDAQLYLNRVVRDMDLGAWTEPSRESLCGFLERWLKDVATAKMKPGTLDTTREYLERYLKPELEGVRLDRLGPADVQACYGRLSARGLSPGTVRRAHDILSSALTQALKWGLVPRNVASLAELPRGRKHEMIALDPEQAAAFLRAAESDGHYALWAFLLSAGTRPGEALALRWQDLDLAAGVAAVRQSLTWRSGGGFVFTDPKTTGSKRRIPLPADLVPVLKAHRAAQARDRLAAGEGWADLDLVFATEDGTPFRRENLTRRHLKPILKAAGLPHAFRMYDLRHTCATLLLAAGTNPKVVAERLGHASVTLTLNTYSHVLPTMQEQASNALNEMLFARRPGQQLG